MNPLLKTDAYKLFHREQYPDNTTLVYSNWTPRSSRHYTGNNEDGVVVFGVQAVVKRLISDFDEYFFKIDKDVAVREYANYIRTFTGVSDYSVEHIEYLHDLQKLPLVIKALPEGVICPIGVPAVTMYNTDPKCFWLTNYLETLFSAELWPHMTNATIAREYRQIMEQYGRKTGVPSDFIDWQLHDFSMRGLYGGDSSSFGMGHLLFSKGTDTIPAFVATDKLYGSNGLIASSVPASEHSVQCSHYTGEGDESAYMRHMLDTYPTGIVSIVCDGFDYWNFMTKVVPLFKDEIIARDGRVVFRPDSGNIVDMVCGLRTGKDNDYEYLARVSGVIWSSDFGCFVSDDDGPDRESLDSVASDTFGVVPRDKYNPAEETGSYAVSLFKVPEYEVKGSMEILWDIFGGTEIKGEDGEIYRHLDTHVGLIYGDSVTIPIAKQICERLVENGMSTNNLVLGIGSYTYQFNTRDTFGFAMKATYIEQTVQHDSDGFLKVGKEIFKDPKTKGNMNKKSLKGLIKVESTALDMGEMEINAVDQVDWETEKEGLLREVFRDGELLIDESFDIIRERAKETL